MNIDFAVWAPTEQIFWDSWIKAGVCSEPRVFTAEYYEVIVSDQTMQGWVPTRSTGKFDELGDPIREAVPGLHANVRFSGSLVEQFTYGLEQADKDGAPRPLFDRTWVKEVFSLTEQPQDVETGFPAGVRNAEGVVYCDVADLKSPTSVWG